jgi:hypothetical protein
VDVELNPEYVTINKTNSAMELVASIDFSDQDVFYVAALEDEWFRDGVFAPLPIVVKRTHTDYDDRDPLASLSVVGLYIPRQGYCDLTRMGLHPTVIGFSRCGHAG